MPGSNLRASSCVISMLASGIFAHCDPTVIFLISRLLHDPMLMSNPCATCDRGCRGCLGDHALGGEQAEEATALQAQLAEKEREVAELRQRLVGLMPARGSGGKIPEGVPKS